MKMAVDLHFCIKMEVEFINICFELLTITDVTVEPFFMEIKVGGDVNFSAFLIATEHQVKNNFPRGAEGLGDPPPPPDPRVIIVYI